MKKPLSMIAICALAMGANAEDKSFDMLGRQNNTANYAKTVETAAGKNNMQQNKSALMKASNARYGSLTMGEYEYQLYQGKVYAIDGEEVSEDDFLERSNDKIVCTRELDYADYTDWKYPEFWIYSKSYYGPKDRSYDYESNIFKKSSFTAGGNAEQIHLLSDNYGCLGNRRVAPINWASKYAGDNSYSICGLSSHSTALAYLLTAATAGSVYSSLNRLVSESKGTNHFYPLPYSHDVPVGVATGRNVSAGLEKASKNNDLTDEIDQYVYDFRVTEFAGAGNSGSSGEMTEYGRGLNVITVGSVSPDGVIEKTSSNANPKTGASVYDKPEILNYSNFRFSNKNDLEVAGTEGAAAYTAAMVAKLMKSNPFYKWHPEVVKALLLTSSTNPVTSSTDYTASKLNKKILKGVPNYSAMIGLNRSKFWTGPNNAIDNYGTIHVEEADGIVAGKTYRVAIAWLVNPKSVKPSNSKTEERIPMVFSLNVSQYKGNTATSQIRNATFQYVEFVAKNNNPIKINITRTRNDVATDDIILGFNFYRVP